MELGELEMKNEKLKEHHCKEGYARFLDSKEVEQDKASKAEKMCE